MFDALFSIYSFLATLYAMLDIASSVSSFFSQYWAEIIIVVVGDIAAILVAEMLFERIQRRRSTPKIEIGITEDELGDRIGFLIFSRNKTLKDARARCNDISYPWEEKDGSKLPKKDIFVGDEPSVFYPFAWQYVLLPQDKLDEYRREKFVVLYIDGNRELN